MILADKIIELRKKNGWSQEELAEKLNVSRQSVSKWEGALSTPDLGRILDMARLFGVTTDYLLKDEMEEQAVEQTAEEMPPMRRVTMEEANEYLSAQEQAAGRNALCTLLCILSPVCLISLGGIAEYTGVLSETAAGVIGLVVLLGLVAAAVVGFITTGMNMNKWEFLEKEAFETEYGVSGMVKEKRKEAKPGFVRSIATGVALCILSPVPLIVSSLSNAQVVQAHMVSLLLVMVGAAVVLFIRSGMPWEAMEKLLQEGDYTPEKKRRSPLVEAVSGVYWMIVLAIFLLWGFLGDAWGICWVVWPVGGVLFAAVSVIVEAIAKKKDL
ncbi:MAG: helix-turn-helix transcriptional regulator [Clostridia bacterium]|nr:helix-turn-helix transcriptional regulator [Clostridia bacterium]